jgi:hypothetical protein
MAGTPWATQSPLRGVTESIFQEPILHEAAVLDNELLEIPVFAVPGWFETPGATTTAKPRAITAKAISNAGTTLKPLFECQRPLEVATSAMFVSFFF